jgi:predicted nucleic acid-binding protein
MEDVFRNALVDYVERRVKFADAVIAAWGLERGIKTVYTFDERDFKKIKGLEARKPAY